MNALVVADTVALALLAVVVVAVLRAHARCRALLGVAGTAGGGEAPADRGVALVGSPAPPVRGVGTDGRPVGVDLAAGALLVFLSSGCRRCAPLWAAAAAWSAAERRALVVVTPDPSLEPTDEVRALAGAATVIMASEAWLAYGVRGSGFVYVVDDGVVTAAGPADDGGDLLALARR